MYYTPTDCAGNPMPDRKGQQFGPFVVARNPTGIWQLDHWPTGFRVLPSNTTPGKFGYNSLRRIASKLKNSPAFRATTPSNHANGTWPRTEAMADLLAAVKATQETTK